MIFVKHFSKFMHLNVCSLDFIIFLLFTKVSSILVEMVEDQSASLFYINSLKKCFEYFLELFSWKFWLCFWITLINQILFICQNSLKNKNFFQCNFEYIYVCNNNLDFFYKKSIEKKSIVIQVEAVDFLHFSIFLT